ncbi:hypothetical protein [Clostridium botulinum]|uniref:Uncharacterized protein n=1 Tax=Clostridium botulinum CFSAN001627 TaxID=1232189 RepID=M1ZYA1_CLOBO|nr:hypothetical protein [Clostridium botulinum]EKN42594.1 hypothetical protein CFSAN001627_05757 [Clostridium botulinum CFSAN001627]APC84964.1 hypothetical protein NPD12_1122 [Clostridium botulinum]AXG95718.1 hypothetical protein AGE31_08485 [Clostridium botulinum]EDT82448.1 hypothetical protein CBN_0999 [Clostridium botulinum NCTC 2916]KEI86354.1 hypothetical protein N492_04740 [Clostridium botulinum B2 267]
MSILSGSYIILTRYCILKGDNSNQKFKNLEIFIENSPILFITLISSIRGNFDEFYTGEPTI